MGDEQKWAINPAWITAEYRLVTWDSGGFRVVHKDSEEYKAFEANRLNDTPRFFYDAHGNQVEIPPFTKTP